MRVKALLLFAAVLLCLSSAAPAPIPSRSAESGQDIQEYDTTIFNPQCIDNAGYFSEGLAPVTIGAKSGYVNTRGKVAIPVQFDDASEFSDGLARVGASGKYGYIGKGGKFVIKPRFTGEQQPGNFSDGLAILRKGKFGFIDKKGEVVIKPQFDEAFDFSDGLALVKYQGKYGYIDITGKFVIKPTYEAAWYFFDGLAPVKAGGKWGYVNREGNLVIAPLFDYEYLFTDKLAPVEIGRKWGFIDKHGTFIVQPSYDYAEPFSEGLAAVRVGRKIGFINTAGRLVITPQWEPIGLEDFFSNGLALVLRGKRYGYIDKKGAVVVKPKFDSASYFSEGLAMVKLDNKPGFIDTTGKYIISPKNPCLGPGKWVLPSSSEKTSVPIFSDYRNIKEIFKIGGSYWFVDPCEGIVFEYSPSKELWRTYLAKNLVDLIRTETWQDCRYAAFSFLQDGYKIGFYGPPQAVITQDQRGSSVSYIDLFFFDTKRKIFGTDRVGVKEHASAFRSIAPATSEDAKGQASSGFWISEKGKKSFYKMPETKSRDFFKLRPWHPRDDFPRVMNESIGPWQKVGNKIWFGLTFYEGEGFDGVGGIGYFDLNTRRYHLSKLQILRDYSVEEMNVDWPWMWLSTGGHYELSDAPGTGLLRIDLTTLALKHPLIEKIKLSRLPAENISFLKKVGPYLWVISVSGIHLFNTENGEWRHFGIKLKMLKKTPLFSCRPDQSMLSGEENSRPKVVETLMKGETANYYSTMSAPVPPDWKIRHPFYEVETRSWQTVFVDFSPPNGYWCRDLTIEGGRNKDCGALTYFFDRNGATAGCINFGPLKIISEIPKLNFGVGVPLRVKAEIRSGWIPADSAVPFVAEKR